MIFMKRTAFLFHAVPIAFLLSTALPAFCQMTDQAVIEYITESVSKGKSKTQIGNELIAKGVTAAQIKRLMSTYKQNMADDVLNISKEEKKAVIAESPGTLPDNDVLKDKKTEIKEQVKKGENPLDAVDKLSEHEEKDNIVFGHDLFQNKTLTFEPNQNVAIPSDYVLGPGDELLIEIYGMNEDVITKKIKPEGSVNIHGVGPIYLSGLTIEQATGKLRSALSAKYSLDGENPLSNINVSLINIRTIQINILGEVKTPGTYRLSSLATVLNALYNAGGITSIGSMRSIQLVRNGRIIQTLDIYKILFDGSFDNSISLKEGDAIIVPTYDGIVNVAKGVKRPMLYEIVKDEPLGEVLKYAGGLTAMAYQGSVFVQRQNGSNSEVFTVKSSEFSDFTVIDGDVIKPYLTKSEDVLTNKVTIEGFVLRPGTYELGGEIATVRQLVAHAGGLLDGAFLQRAQLLREKPDRTLSLEGIAIGSIVDGTSPDILLRKNDKVTITSVNEMEKKGDVHITGYVSNPGSFVYADGITIEDLILLAGGLEEGASSVCVEVGRRIEVDGSVAAQDTIARVFTCDFSNDLSLSEGSKFVLMPNDIVSVRKNPTYIQQRTVLVTGEVNFPGTYTLVANNQRLSDLVARAGGATNYANIKAASLKRKVSEYERNVRRNMVNMVKKGAQMDSLQIERLKIYETYTVGISLENALWEPGCEDDIILQDGDELIIPNWTNTVRVQGEVYYPNAVNYVSGKPLKYYVNQSGGWTNEAKRNKVYVVYMNGKVSVGKNSKIMPGCEVVVPSKPEKKKMTTGEWVGIGTATASMAASIASIVALVINSRR